MRNTLLLLSILLSTLISCNKDDLIEPIIPSVDKSIETSWEHSYYQDSIQILHKVNKLSKNEYGFTFEKNGKFIENKNSGGCGTPPITYAEYEGDWTRISENIIKINVDFWGGETTYHMRIMSVSKNSLKIHTLY